MRLFYQAERFINDWRCLHHIFGFLISSCGIWCLQMIWCWLWCVYCYKAYLWLQLLALVPFVQVFGDCLQNLRRLDYCIVIDVLLVLLVWPKLFPSGEAHLASTDREIELHWDSRFQLKIQWSETLPLEIGPSIWYRRSPEDLVAIPDREIFKSGYNMAFDCQLDHSPML